MENESEAEISQLVSQTIWETITFQASKISGRKNTMVLSFCEETTEIRVAAVIEFDRICQAANRSLPPASKPTMLAS